MNANKVRDAAKLLIAALNEEETTITLKLNKNEVSALKAICWCTCTVPDTVSRQQPPVFNGTKKELSDLLVKIQDQISC